MDDDKNEIKISIRFRAENENEFRVTLKCIIMVLLLIDSNSEIYMGVNDKSLAMIQEFLEISSHQKSERN